MWRVTHEWTRTAPLPPEAENSEIRSKGSAFTREFHASFECHNGEALKAWIAASPGFSDAEMTTEADGTKVYQIKPGGGALFAEIRIHPNLDVRIRAHWS